MLEHVTARSPIECSVVTQHGSYLAAESARLSLETILVGGISHQVTPAVISRLRAGVRSVDPDLVHVHGGRAAVLHALARTSYPTVYTVHGCHFAYQRAASRRARIVVERLAMSRADAVIFVCEHDEWLARSCRALPPATTSYVIPNGVHLAPRHPATIERHVAWVGRLEYPKDPELFVETMACLPGHTATVVGDGTLRKRVELARNRLGLSGRVHLLGEQSREAALKVLDTADVLLLTSRWEGLPYVALEAAALGVPVVATRVGGVPEVIAHGETGLVVRARTPDALAAAVCRVTDNRSVRTTMAVAAQQRATHFTAERMLSRTRHVYDEVAQR